MAMLCDALEQALSMAHLQLHARISACRHGALVIPLRLWNSRDPPQNNTFCRRRATSHLAVPNG